MANIPWMIFNDGLNLGLLLRFSSICAWRPPRISLAMALPSIFCATMLTAEEVKERWREDEMVLLKLRGARGAVEADSRDADLGNARVDVSKDAWPSRRVARKADDEGREATSINDGGVEVVEVE